MQQSASYIDELSMSDSGISETHTLSLSKGDNNKFAITSTGTGFGTLRKAIPQIIFIDSLSATFLKGY